MAPRRAQATRETVRTARPAALPASAPPGPVLAIRPGEGIILDLDNTLVHCKEVFRERMEAFAAFTAPRRPDLSAAAIIARFRELDHARQERSGFGRARFPLAMVETYRTLLVETGADATPDDLAAVYAIGDAVFDPARYTPYPGVLAMLAEYRHAGVRVGLCTKGDDAVQRAKVSHWGIDAYLDVVGIFEHKPPAAMAVVAAQLACPPTTCVMIGDSLRDDIAGGNANGMRTVWLRDAMDHASLYEAEHHHVQPSVTIADIRDLPHVLRVRRA